MKIRYRATPVSPAAWQVGIIWPDPLPGRYEWPVPRGGNVVLRRPSRDGPERDELILIIDPPMFADQPRVLHVDLAFTAVPGTGPLSTSAVKQLVRSIIETIAAQAAERRGVK